MKSYFLSLGRTTRIALTTLFGAVPVIGLLLGNRQLFRTSTGFALYEIVEDFRFLVCLLTWIIVLWVFPSFLNATTQRRNALMPTLKQGRRNLFWFRVSLSVLAVYFALAIYLPLRYKAFSEYYFPLRALNYIHAQNMDGARETCDRFIAIYPRKSPTSVTKDFTCASVLELTGVMSQIYRYAVATRPRPRQVERLSLPVADKGRHRSLELLKLIAGEE